ncbi:protein phosphatase 2C domain-containing protein [Nocardiopsis sediminis]|uniref:Protein phosphatase 2C domain-containing protein n=1 Tax=Nocardiopsis sediminis TaxID=1778267 RepID=A0ABV8FJT5_9ACTN
MRYVSEQGQGAVNEDAVVAGAGWAFVLDGATAPPGVDSGCRHGVRWLVDRLAQGLTAELTAPDAHRTPLQEVLAAAILRTRAAHGPGCDLGDPDSPSATTAIVRATGDGLDHLVLGDCTVLLPGDAGPDDAGSGIGHPGEAAPSPVIAVTDDRLEHLPGGRPYSRALVRAARNTEGGFWVAAASVDAAAHAVCGRARSPRRSFALLTDGCTRLVMNFGATWPEAWSLLESGGPESLVAAVRTAERDRPVPGVKRHDDATAAFGAFDPPPPS